MSIEKLSDRLPAPTTASQAVKLILPQHSVKFRSWLRAHAQKPKDHRGTTIAEKPLPKVYQEEWSAEDLTKMVAAGIDPDKNRVQYIGWFDEHDATYFFGINLRHAFNGATSRTSPYMHDLSQQRPEKRAHLRKLKIFAQRLVEIENWWEDYANIGRCLTDRNHTDYQANEVRWDSNVYQQPEITERTCLWCGITQTRQDEVHVSVNTHWSEGGEPVMPFQHKELLKRVLKAGVHVGIIADTLDPNRVASLMVTPTEHINIEVDPPENFDFDDEEEDDDEN